MERSIRAALNGRPRHRRRSRSTSPPQRNAGQMAAAMAERARAATRQRATEAAIEAQRARVEIERLQPTLSTARTAGELSRHRTITEAGLIEREKYEAMWSHPAYRTVAPGEYAVAQFLEVANPAKGQTVRDLGCGTGRAGQRLADCGLDVTQYDFATNCRDAGIDLPFVQHDLNNVIPGISDFAFCTDVLEHIPREQVKRVLRCVVAAARRVYLQISCTPDHMGQLIGESLHLTVEPYAWWKAELEEFDCKIEWSEDREHTCSFLVSGYASAEDFVPKTVLNVSHETIEANIRGNLAGEYREVAPHARNDVPLMVLAGGPSLGRRCRRDRGAAQGRRVSRDGQRHA